MPLPSHPMSDATTEAGFFADLSRQTLRNKQSNGTAPETLGVTVPFAAPQTAQDFTNAMTSWTQSAVNRRGPVAYDNSNTSFQDSYIQKRYEFISDSEAVRKYAYDDKTGRQITDASQVQGKRTVGVGFNMDRPDARNVMREAIGADDATFDAVYNGKQALTDTQIRKLFDYNANEAEKVVQERLAGVTLDQRERLALVSMAFNGPSLIGPKLVGALQSGDKQAALDEILYNSNRKGIPGLATRRYIEAAMFRGMDGGTAKAKLPSQRDYMARLFPNTQVAMK